MKAILFFSSIFFLLGLKIGKLVDLGGNINIIEKVIPARVNQSKPVKALPLFKNTEEEEATEENKEENKEIQKQESSTPDK